MSDDLHQLADLVRERSGIALHGARRIDALSAALAKMAPGMDAAAALRAAGDPEQAEPFVTALLEAVAVHETFFLRQRRDLDAIDWRALLAAALAAGSAHARVWVAGCSTGEEAYTLALLAAETFGGDPPVAILATDLSSAAIAHGVAGRYGSRSSRNLDPPLRERYFEPDGGQLVVGAGLRRLVTFRRHNLVTDPPPDRRFELVICRNVLIYFDPPTVEQVLDTLADACMPDGVLLLGAADRLCRPLSTAPSRRLAPQRRERRKRVRSDAPALSRGASAWRERAGRPSGVEHGTAEDKLAGALADANGGRVEEALAATKRILAEDPLNADAQYVRGVAALGQGDAVTAADALRRALYVDPGFALAAFTLARAHDTLGDEPAARRAYLQTLRTLAPGHERQHRLVADVDLADIAAACGARLAALTS
jgi:chemotaxis protein methyltransferase CheR